MQLDGERRRAEEAGARMASLVDAGLSLSRELRLDDLLARIVQAAREVVGARYAALGVLDADRTELVEFVTAGLDQAEREAIGDLPRGRGLLGALIRDARPLRLERISDDPRSVGFPANHPPMESFLGVPVGFRGEVYGNLYLTDKLGGPFTEEDQQIALTLASQAAVAVDNVRRLELERRRADELESVQEVARAVLTTLDVDSLLPLVARRARRLTGAQTVGVAVSGGDDLVFRYAHGVNALTLEGTRVPPEMGAVRSELERTLGVTAVEACALELDDAIVGALVAVGSRPFDDDARRLLATFSSHVALALANARAVGDKLRAGGGGGAARGRRRAGAGGRRGRAARDRGPGRGARAPRPGAARRGRPGPDGARRAPAGAGGRRAGEALCGTGWPSCAARSARPRRPCASWPRASGPPRSRRAGSRAPSRSRRSACGPAADMEVDVDLRGLDADLPEDVQIALFRVVQEALTNVVRHSEAASVSIVADRAGVARAAGGRRRRPRLRHLGADRAPRPRGHPRARRAAGRGAAGGVVARRRDRRRGRPAARVTGPIRILLVDDHAVLRSGLRLLLEREEGLEPVGEAGTAEDAVRSLPRLQPDVVVIDVEMPGIGGIDGAERIRERAPGVRILVLSMHDRPQDVRRAFDAGADGYLPKAAADEDLVRAIRAVAAGERYVHPSLGAALAAPPSAGPIEELSEREREVLRLLALGHTNQEIAEQLIVSVRTVESHRAHVMTKLRVSTRAGLVRAALDAGLMAEDG